MNRFEEIETFSRTVEAGSFTAAAAQLGVAKSVVSRRISELEQRLQVQLIVRSTRKLSLTDEGQSLYDQMTRLLSEWEEAETSIAAQQTSLQGSIRVSLPLSFGMAYIGPWILDFQRRHPAVVVDLDFTDRKVDLIAEGYDLAVRIGDLADSNLVARKLAPITITAAASPKYLQQHGTPQTPIDLRNHSELRFGLRTRKSWVYTAPDGQSGEIEMPSTLRANNGDFLCDAAADHRGVVILPRFIVYRALLAGDLVEILPGYRWAEFNAYAIYPSTRHLPKRVRELIVHLQRCCGDGMPHWDQ